MAEILAPIIHEITVTPEFAREMTDIAEEAATHAEREVARMSRSIRYTQDDCSRGAGEAVRDVFRRHQFRVGP